MSKKLTIILWMISSYFWTPLTYAYVEWVEPNLYIGNWPDSWRLLFVAYLIIIPFMFHAKSQIKLH